MLMKKEIIEDNRVLRQENKKLQERIDKAIEYINRFDPIRAYYEYQDGEYWETNYDDDFKDELLEILKGEDK